MDLFPTENGKPGEPDADKDEGETPNYKARVNVEKYNQNQMSCLCRYPVLLTQT